MKNSLTNEIIITLGLVVVAVLLLNPFHFWMPNLMIVGILVSTLVLFGVFASFILREGASDERENAHRTLAGRNAFLTGSALLLTGIIFQSFSHQVDPWLVVTLIVMIVAKIGTRLWSDKNR